MTHSSKPQHPAEMLISALTSQFGVETTMVNGGFDITIDGIGIDLNIKTKANLIVLYSSLYKINADDEQATHIIKDKIIHRLMAFSGREPSAVKRLESTEWGG